MSLILQKFQKQPSAGTEKPEKVTLLKIKYVYFSPKIKICYWKISHQQVEHKNPSILTPYNSVDFASKAEWLVITQIKFYEIYDNSH